MKLVYAFWVSLSALTVSYTLNAMEETVKESKKEEDYVQMSVKEIQKELGHKIMAAVQGAVQQKAERENPTKKTAVPIPPPAPGIEAEPSPIGSRAVYGVASRVPSEIKVKVDVNAAEIVALLHEQAQKEQEVRHEFERKMENLLERILRDPIEQPSDAEKQPAKGKGNISWGSYRDKLLFWGALAGQATAIGVGLYAWFPGFKNAVDKAVVRAKEGYRKTVNYCKKNPLSAFAFGSALAGLGLSGWWCYMQPKAENKTM